MIRSILLVVALACLVVSAAEAEANAAASFDWGFSGYETVNASENGNLFYWGYMSQNDPANDPVIIWLTGGPGCSGELALLFENGPFTVDEHLNPIPNPYSWTNNATVLWIDQPYGVGFSYVDDPSMNYVSDETEVADDVYSMLLSFFKDHSDLMDNDLFVVGESYGGHYSPSVSARIVQGGVLNFKGCAIGNGMVSAIDQFPAYADFSYDVGLVTEQQQANLTAIGEECVKLIEAEQWQDAYDTCLEIIGNVLTWTGINPYNYAVKCPPQFPGLCYNFTAPTDFLNLETTQAALGVNKTWETCNYAVNARFDADWVHSFSDDVAYVLSKGHKVLVYSGQLDFICNYFGGLAWTKNLDWPSQDAWNALEFADWTVDGVMSGLYKTGMNMTFIAVAGAGHMVPHDQPANALSMINAFTHGLPWNS